MNRHENSDPRTTTPSNTRFSFNLNFSQSYSLEYTLRGKKIMEQEDSNKKKNMKTLASMLDPFHHFIHESNNWWVKMENNHQNRA